MINRNDIGGQIEIRGSKVLIRKFTESDISEEYIQWLNDSEVMRYSNNRFRKHDRASALRYLKSFEGSENLFLSVHRASDDKAIGTQTVYISPMHGTADMGLMIGSKEVWGEGYGLDAWRSVLDWLLNIQNIRKVTAGTLACNIGMIKVMERSGMHKEATRRSQELVNNEAVDMHYYARFRDI